jgi:hypothetical protein
MINHSRCLSKPISTRPNAAAVALLAVKSQIIAMAHFVFKSAAAGTRVVSLRPPRLFHVLLGLFKTGKYGDELSAINGCCTAGCLALANDFVESIGGGNILGHFLSAA